MQSELTDQKKIRIVFMGTPDFAVASLDVLVQNGYNIAGVITIPPAVAFGGDFLFGDQGNDQLYGDLVSLLYHVEAGPNSSQTLNGTPLSFGNDVLDGGVGDDTLVGDVGSIILSATASTSTPAT